jgi:predicted transcriptional regulator of viral defense system
LSEKYHFGLKTLGPRAAQLFTELNELRRTTFTLADVVSITGLSAAAARSLVHKTQQRGLITRLKPGLYNLVPFELGRATKYIDSPYLIARELAGAASYFLSHGTAFELHRMSTQPNFTVYASCTRRVRPQTIGGYDFQFIHITQKQEFGVVEHWIDKERFVMISDMERTIIDGLRHPAFEYAQRLDIGAVVRRLGYLLEHYELADESALEPLRNMLTATYQRLDPLLPAEGTHVSRWRLQLNVTPEELDATRVG